MYNISVLYLTHQSVQPIMQIGVIPNAVKVYDLIAMKNFHWFQHQKSYENLVVRLLD